MVILNKIESKFKALKHEKEFAFPQIKHKNIYLFSIPTFGNIGDLAIVEAERKFLNDNYSDWNLILIPDYATNKAVKFIKENINNEDLILIHGGECR